MASLIPFNRRNTDLINTGFDELYNMLDDFFTESFMPSRSLARDTFKVDVQENEKEYIVEAELPGAEKDEIKLELNDGRLNISVEREEKSEEEKKNYIHKERRYSSMCRSIYLQDVESKNATAKLENGVLTVNIPKIEKVDNTKLIEIE